MSHGTRRKQTVILELKSQVITYHQFYLVTLPSIDKTMLIAAQNSICLAADTQYIDQTVRPQLLFSFDAFDSFMASLIYILDVFDHNCRFQSSQCNIGEITEFLLNILASFFVQPLFCALNLCIGIFHGKFDLFI